MISIHTFLAEGDGDSLSPASEVTRFQSTPSLRKVTNVTAGAGTNVYISIHTFLAEGDWQNLLNWKLM